MKNNKIKIITVSGMLTALSVVLLSIGTVFTTMDLSMAIFTGFIIIFADMVCGKKSAVAVYTATTVLTWLLLPNKLLALFYGLFGGLYPLIKEYAEKVNNKWLSYLLKLVIANVSATIIYFLIKFLFQSDDDLFKMFLPLFYLIINIVFLLYDYAMLKITILMGNMVKRMIK
ncbi:hypothetical protein LJB90_01100 [Eubacteriales bacterium OttesenSCG-928-G02]|nr:hypothetical protein [Eubacteriales bacterium OttesenSCG-928-G02]